jgi:hypothetical protein
MGIDNASRMIAHIYSLACPHCRQIDCIEKVSAIGADRDARLAAPQRPTLPLNLSTALVVLGVGLGLSMSAATLLRLEGIAFLAEPFRIVIVGGLALLGGGSVGLVFLRLAAATSRRAQRTAALKRARWQQADALWRQLVYCSRCDVVFVPGHQSVLPATEVRAALSGGGERHQQRQMPRFVLGGLGLLLAAAVALVLFAGIATVALAVPAVHTVVLQRTARYPALVAFQSENAVHYGAHLLAGRTLGLCPCTRGLAALQYSKAVWHARTPHQRALVTTKRPHTAWGMVSDAIQLAIGGLRWLGERVL